MPWSRTPSVHDGILAHYRSFWRDRRITDRAYTPGRVAQRLPDLRIATVEPDSDGLTILGTIGAWRATEASDHGTEFVAVAHASQIGELQDEIVRRMAGLAYYHAGSTGDRLGVGHTVPLDTGWVPGSPLTAVLVALPYLWGPSLEHCQLPGRHIQIVWLLPIHESERRFKIEHGQDALESRMEAAAFDYWDPFRPPVV